MYVRLIFRAVGIDQILLSFLKNICTACLPSMTVRILTGKRRHNNLTGQFSPPDLLDFELNFQLGEFLKRVLCVSHTRIRFLKFNNLCRENEGGVFQSALDFASK